MRLLTAPAETERETMPARTQRRRGGSRWRRRAAIAGTAVVILAGGFFAAERAGWIATGLELGKTKALSLTAAAGFSVEDVMVLGRDRTTVADILGALQVKRGAPILAASPVEARARLEALPWVRSAAVARLLPDTIAVEITERKPMALWQHGGKFELIDEEGKVLPVEQLGQFSSLPVLVGEGAPEAGAELLAMLAEEPALRDRVAASVRVSDRRWNLRMDNGIDVELPEENAETAWRELARLDRTYGLLERDIRRVDLRLPDRMVLQSAAAPEKPAAPKKKNSGRNT
ncbi:MAG TPA: cell division protein FtsQ/DivIB [Stellaceae bacterium]|nr:cell division protein FtsQ/DivIB [Stellaceae bacterium]